MKASLHRRWRFVAVVALLVATAVASTLAESRTPDVLTQPLSSIDMKIGGWAGSDDDLLSPRIAGALQATSYLSRTYRRPDLQLGLFIAYYGQQHSGAGTMHSPKHCLPGSGWEIWKYDSAYVPVDNRAVKINKYFIQNAGKRMLVLYWYQYKDQIVASEYIGKLVLIRNSLLTGRDSGSIVRIILPDAPGATEEGIAFAANVIPRLRTCFGK